MTTHHPWLKKIALANHFIAHGSGAVGVIRFACPCKAEELLVSWWYGG